MERSRDFDLITVFPQLEKITDEGEFIIYQTILKYRLMGLSEVSIYIAQERQIPLANVRKYCHEVDNWINSSIAKMQELGNISPKDLDKMLTVKRLDYIIEQGAVLYELEGDVTKRRKLLSALANDVIKRADVLGLMTNKKDSSKDDSSDIPELEINQDVMDALTRMMTNDNKGV